MKRVDLPTASVSGQPASPQIKREDFQRLGFFARENLGHFIRDIMMKPSTEAIVMGGEITRAVGMQLDLYAPLAVYRQVDGVEFSLYSDVQVSLVLDAGDTLPRVDLIVAELHENSPQNSGLRHFRQDPPIPGKPEGDVNVADELWDHGTISIVKGTASVTPTPPSLPANSVLLYTVSIPANATVLSDALIADGRRVVLSQEAQDEEIARLKAKIGEIGDTFKLPLGADQVLVLPGAGKYSNWRVQQVIADLANQSDDDSFDPLTRPETLMSAGKLGGVPNLESSVPVVDIPVGARVAFSNCIRPVNQTTLPATLNPRLVNLSGSAGTDTDVKDISPLTLSQVFSITSDGGGVFIARNASCPTRTIRPSAAARDERYIEVYGGATEQGTQISNWFTYDTVNDTVIPRTLTGVPLPPIAREMFSCGDGVHVLVAASPAPTPDVGAQFQLGEAGNPGTGQRRISGFIQAQSYSGPSLAGVLVKFRNTGTNVEVTQTTSASGYFSFVAEAGNSYTITLSKAGFVTTVLSITMDSDPAIDLNFNYTVYLQAENVAANQDTRWFLVNTTTWVADEKLGGPGAHTNGKPYRKFVGDLIQPGIIAMFAEAGDPVLGSVHTWWRYDIAAGNFAQIAVSGDSVYLGPYNAPGVITLDGPSAQSVIAGCILESGKLALFVPAEPSGYTYIFDYPTLTLRNATTGTQPASPYSTALSQFRMTNIGGRVILFAGQTNDNGTIGQYWALTSGSSPQWSSYLPSGLPPRFWSPGAASLIVSGLPRGQGFVIGGLDARTYVASSAIYAFGQGGVIETQYNGVTGLTLAPGTRSATIRLNDYQVNLAGAVANMLLSLAGLLPAGSVSVSISLDAGAHFQAIPRDRITAILNSSTPGQRQLLITMYAQGTVVPIITGVHEVFEKTGGPSLSGTFIRITVPAGTRGLYIKRDGTMEVVSGINPTTPDKAILLKMIHNGSGVQPSVKNYVNQRRLLIEYSGVKGGSNPQFDYDGGVAPTFIRATGVTGGATGAVYRIAKPTIAFDGTVTVAGLSGSTDNYFVEAEA